MKRDIFDLEGDSKGEVELPEAFEEEIRPDIIRRAVEAVQANRRQRYGTKPKAGMEHSTEVRGRGEGRARVQRLKDGNDAAVVPQTVGGRQAHPPKSEKDYSKKINKKEMTKARRSALAALSAEKLVKKRGHEIDNDSLTYPVVVESGIEDLEKTKEAIELLDSLGIYEDVERAEKGKNVRAGKGKSRGRKYRTPVSVLVVLPQGSTGRRAFENLEGVTVKHPESLTVEDLAPGGHLGRLTIFSVKALNQMKRWNT